MFLSSIYTEIRTTEGPQRRTLYEKISWAANSLSLLYGVLAILAAFSISSILIPAFGCLNVYVLLGDYIRWAQMRKLILKALFVLLGLNLLIFLVEHFFVFQAGFYKNAREGEQIALFLHWFSLFWYTGFLLCSFLTTYYLYPDELALLSEEHPAAKMLTPTVKEMAERKTEDKPSVKMFDSEVVIDQEKKVESVEFKVEENKGK